MSVTYRVMASWDGSGLFTGDHDDITAYVVDTLAPISIRRGFSSDMDRIATIGTALLVLDNSDQRFSPNYGSGPLHGLLAPMVRLKIEASSDNFASVTWGLFYGYIKRIRIMAGLHAERLAYLEAEDALSVLQRQRFAQPLQENRTADDLYSLILSETFQGNTAIGYAGPYLGTTAPNDGDTVTIGTTTYTFKTSIGAAYDVLIGTASGSYQNLAAAINNGEVNSQGAGVIYGTDTLKHPAVSAVFEVVEWTEVVNWAYLTCLYRGALGNNISVSTNAAARISVMGMDGGVDQPIGKFSHDAGLRTYTIAMDRWTLENTNAAQALDDVARSEFGWVWVAGDGTITTKTYDWEEKQAAVAAVMTMNNTHSQMEAVIDDDQLANRVEVTNTPIRETAGVVVARATNTITVPGTQTTERWNQTVGLPNSGSATTLPNNAVVVRLPFVDIGTGQVTGAKDIITPIRGTDFTISDALDGSGFNYTTDPNNMITCSAVVTGSGVEVTFTNKATGILYLFNFQVRGTRIDRYDPQTILREDAASITLYGTRSLSYDLPLDAGDNFPTALANGLLARYKTPAQRATPVVVERVIGGVNPLSLDIGDRVDVVEDQTVSNFKALVRGLEYELNSLQGRMTIHLKDMTDLTYWILNDNTYGVLNTTTRLGL